MACTDAVVVWVSTIVPPGTPSWVVTVGSDPPLGVDEHDVNVRIAAGTNAIAAQVSLFIFILSPVQSLLVVLIGSISFVFGIDVIPKNFTSRH
jgi:hypothetical protein